MNTDFIKKMFAKNLDKKTNIPVVRSKRNNLLDYNKRIFATVFACHLFNTIKNPAKGEIANKIIKAFPELSANKASAYYVINSATKVNEFIKKAGFELSFSQVKQYQNNEIKSSQNTKYHLIGDVAKKCNVGVQRIRKLCDSGKIDFARISYGSMSRRVISDLGMQQAIRIFS